MFDVLKIRKDFPILGTTVNGRPLVYFDNAASSQKPQCVISAIEEYYKLHHSNIHRAFHYLGDKATMMYEQARAKVANYINASGSSEIIFTRGTTESINLIATSLERSNKICQLDEIVISVAEHHSNIVPWQMLAEKTGAVIKVIHLLPSGELDLKHLYGSISSKTKVLALNHVSNGMGIINPMQEIIAEVKKINKGILVLVDGAQALPSFKVNVRELNCDFYAFSGHKMYGPTGIGVLFGKQEIMQELPPYQGGGEMINEVILPMGTTYAKSPHKFEAGTPNIAGAIGLAAAIDYLNSLDFEEIKQHKENLLQYCTEQLKKIDNINIIGDSAHKISVVAFTVNNMNPQDVGLLLDQYGIAVRTGHHCNMPLMNYLNIPGTIRVSFGIYNTIEEIDVFVASLKNVLKILNV